MKIRKHLSIKLVGGGAILALAACTSMTPKPDSAENARAQLTRLQSDTQLATRAPLEIKQAELAVRAAEKPQKDVAAANHLVLMAERKVELATAWAQSRLLVDQRKLLADQRDKARLDARTQEANLARNQAASARAEANSARDAAASARIETNSARDAAASSRADANSARTEANSARDEANAALEDASATRIQLEAAQARSDELQQQITLLNAKPTERGLVVTLGDLLFANGKADLRGSATDNLDKLTAFLNKYPDRSMVIEGHTDNVGSEAANLSLSQLRADSVKSYLMNDGIAARRLSATGLGEAHPVASNESVAGRQQNRRVEVIISNPVTASR